MSMLSQHASRSIVQRLAEPLQRQKLRARCQCCPRQSRWVPADSDGEPDLWAMPRGWSTAPFPADFEHSDGSVGSKYTCPACNARLRKGETLQVRPVGAVFSFSAARRA
jgi:Zn finger protein HypA/HybF involved in hydrogenase expression